MKKSVTWVVVADHQNARVFRNDGPNLGLVPVDGWSMEKPLKAGRDIMADRPGRSFDSHGVGKPVRASKTVQRALKTRAASAAR